MEREISDQPDPDDEPRTKTPRWLSRYEYPVDHSVLQKGRHTNRKGSVLLHLRSSSTGGYSHARRGSAAARAEEIRRDAQLDTCPPAPNHASGVDALHGCDPRPRSRRGLHDD